MQNEATLEQLKRAVKLQRLLQQGIIAKKKAARPLLSLADRTKPLQLSWGQQRLWFVDQLDSSASAAYHMPSALRLSGLLDTGALRSALDRIVARHEILRTTFKMNEDGPVQSIAPADIGLELLEHDLCNLMGTDLENEIELLSKQAHGAPFDLTKGPLIRGRLLRIDKDQHILFLTQHHIISDGWSISLLIQEVGALYTAFLANQPDPLPPLTIQYADYSTWQREWLQGDELQQQLSFWTQELSGAPELLQLPTDHQRPATQSFAGSTIAVEMSATLVSELNALSKRNGATLFMTLLAAWAVVLARLVGGNDIVIGTPVANRQRAEVERLLGLFCEHLGSAGATGR
ncbi:condensation domain-containing protein [Xanthomonas sacchari]|nr:condensation domain-containing protein [Xanthomonas sacchari]UYK68512.1 condensation domain-containing protein [Xanthomonas sacchari]